MQNKVVPKSIQREAIKALSYFPELNDTKIIFHFKDRIRKSTMQAQPTWLSLVKSKNHRSYIILISRNVQFESQSLSVNEFPSDVLIGWLGHELGHIVDYSRRSRIGMIILGIKYLFSTIHFKEIERTADAIAVARGMGEYILKTKKFILEHSDLSEKYKSRIKRLYMSPEEVMHLIKEKNNQETISTGL